MFRGGGIKEVHQNLKDSNDKISKSLILHIGSNDVASTRQGNLEKRVDEMKALLQLVKKKYPNTKIYVSLVLPCLRNNVLNTKSKIFNQKIRNLAKQFKVTYINHYLFNLCELCLQMQLFFLLIHLQLQFFKAPSSLQH